MSIKAKLIITLALIIGILASVLLYAYTVIGESSRQVMAIYDRPMMSSNFARDALMHFREVAAILDSKNRDKAKLDHHFSAIADDLRVVGERMVAARSRDFLEEFRNLLSQARDAVESNDEAALAGLLPVASRKIDMLIESEFSSGYDYVLNAKNAIDWSNHILIVTGVVVLLIALGGGFYLLFSIVRPIRQCVAISQRIAAGHFDNAISGKGSGEFMMLLDALRVMQSDLVRHIEERQRPIIAALDEETARLNAVMNNVMEAIITIDEKGIIQSFNREAETMFGYAAGEAAGKNVSLLMPEPHKSQHDGYLRHHLETGEQKIIGKGREAMGLRRDGSLFPVAISVAKIVRDRKPLFVGVLRDITEQKSKEAALEYERDRAERANQAKSEFLANMSHELRTPLNSMLGMTRLLLESKLDPDQQQLTTTVFQSSRTLLEIVNDILDLSKIEAGEMTLERIGMSLGYILDSAAQAIEQVAREKRIALERHYAKETFPYVLGDPTRLGRVLVNLVGNAIKYTNKGSVRVRAGCTRLDDRHVEFCCEITDTGIGIPKEMQQRIFEKFVQGDTTTTRKYGGTGLGLAITKQLVELMGGRIGVESEVGLGSTFWFTIPFEVTDCLSEEKSIRRKRMTAGAISPSAARVLVAEDHPMNQMFMTTLLKRFGIGTFVLAETGTEVLRRYAGQSWDVILMDCHMPEKNGYDTTLEIRAMEKKAGGHVPIVAMTANAMVGDKEKCLRCGMDEYVSKPISIDELKEVLGQWIRFEGPGAPPAEPPSPVVSVPAPVDLGMIRSFSERDRETEKQLIGIFFVQSDENLRALEQNRLGDDPKTWSETAHMLKGGAASVGAAGLAELCHQAQHFSGAPEERRALFEKINAEYARVKSYFRNAGYLT